ncbi:MAG: DUF481 domain-containing protein [Bacteroidota bacterium]
MFNVLSVAGWRSVTNTLRKALTTSNHPLAPYVLRFRPLLFCLTLLFVLLLCTCVRAQIVNIEDKRKALDSLGWFGQVDLGAKLNQNRNQVLTLSGALRLDRLGKRGNVLILADYRLVQVDDNNGLNAGFLHARYGYEPKGKDGWRWETFGQVQYNEQLNLTVRFLLGSGIRRRLYRKGNSRAYLGILYMYEYDELAESEIIYRDYRLSNYLTFRLKPTDNLTLASTTYYQPRLPDFNDTRVSTILSATITISKRFSFNSRFSLTHDERLNRDVPSVPATTYAWINGVRLNF